MLRAVARRYPAFQLGVVLADKDRILGAGLGPAPRGDGDCLGKDRNSSRWKEVNYAEGGLG